MQVSTLRPGLLVSLSVRLQGNISYATQEIEPDHFTGTGTREATWQTTRVIEDPAEHEAAIKARSKARSLVTGVCSPSSFGLLCPEADREKLTDAIAEARELVDRFNARAVLTQVSLYIIIGRVAADDVEAVRAINSEVRGLLTEMERGLQRLDVAAVRDAANRARALAAMLSPDAADKAKAAIEAARSAARQIVKAGEAAAVEIDAATLNRIRMARTAFIDMDDGEEVRTPEAAARSIDLDIQTEPVPPVTPAAPTFQIEL